MSFLGGGMGMATGPASGLRFAATRGRIQGGAMAGVNYPSPFFDVAHTYLPVTVKALFKWCRYYFLTNPLINATCFKLSEYPVTDIIFDHESPEVKKKWTEYFQDHLRYRAFQIEAGLDYHCLSGDTRVVTEAGVVPIRELVGSTVRVLSEGGVYREASFHFYGKQRLWEVHTEDGVLLATDEHQWPVWDPKQKKTVKVVTKSLKNRAIPRVVAPRPEKNEDFWTGVRHGIVFGDGTLSNENRQAHLILYTPEKRTLARYFEGHSSAITPHHEEKYLGVYGLPPEFKQLPKDAASASYWYGFTCGLLATDGSVSKRDGATTLNQKLPAALLAISARLPWFGLLGGKVREYWQWSELTKQEEPVNVLNLKKQYLRPEDFIRADQREMFVRHFKETGYGRFIGVKKVVPTDKVDDVFCCIEPETHTFVIEHGVLTGNCYGNGCISLGFPFKKYLHCTSCGFSDEAAKIRASWIFTSFQFRLTCPKCQYVGDARAADQYYKNASGIKTIRWNPEDIEITYNDISGECTYFYTIPATIRNDVVIGRKDVVEGVPQVFIQAMREQKGVIFSKDNFFHLKRPTLATQDRGWGTPLLLPVLKDTFYLQVMKKAQEAILLEHIVPLRILFPQAGSGSSDPYCVAPETLVETPSGLRPASEIGQGDYLRSHTGAWRRVLGLKRRAVRQERNERVFQVKVASLPAFPFKVSEEHPLLAVRRVSQKQPRAGMVDPEFIPVRELKKGDYVAYPARRVTRSGQELDLAAYLPERAATEQWVYRRLSQGAAEAYEWLEYHDDVQHAWGERKKLLEEKGWLEADYATAAAMRREPQGVDRAQRFRMVSPALARLIGYYLAEGSRNGSLVSFSLNLNEKDIADTIEQIVKGLGFRGVSHSERPAQHGRSVQVEDVFLSGLLIGLCGEGFLDKRVPDIISEGQDSLVLEMLRGLFAGDGCDFKTGTNRVALKLSNPSMILEARRLLLSFGLIGGVIKEEHDEDAISKADSYHLNYNGLAADKLRVLLDDAASTLSKARTARERFDATAAGTANDVVAEELPARYPFSDVPQKSGLFRGDYVLLRIDEIEPVAGVPEVVGFEMDEDKSFCVAGVATHNTTINLIDWRDQIAAEIGRWRMDNNYIPILPLPVGNQTIGGDGRALLLTQEITTWSDQILNGMGVPTEFIRGGMSYAGTNVSMRMMENMFLGYILRQKALAKFIMKQVAAYMGWPEATIRFKPFKMADDLQRKAFLFQLNTANKVSDTTLLADSDLSQDEENEIMIRETDKRLAATKKQQLAMAEIQGEAQLITMKFQAKGQETMMKAQQAPNAPGEPGGPEQQMQGGAPGGQGGEGGAAMPQEMQGATAPGGQGAPAEGFAPGTPPPADLPGGMGGGAPDNSPQSFLAQTSSQLTGKNQGQGGIDLPALAMAQARTIALMPEKQQETALQNLELQSPELAGLVRQMLASLQPAKGKEKSTTNAVDMRPMPEQLPPRRAV